MININKFKITEHMECSTDTKLFFDDVYKSSTRTKKAQVETVQYGRSMIEMLGVLAIVGVLSVGGIAGYSKAMEKFKINKTIDEISHIVTNIRTLYAQQTTYLGLDEETAYQMGGIPDSLKVTSNGSTITHAFDGRLQINGTWLMDGTGKYFAISLSGLSEKACLEIATMDWGSPSSSGFVALTVADAYVGSAFASNFDIETCSGGWYNLAYACPGNSNNPSPMSVAKAAEACKSSSEYLELHILFQ